MEAWHPELCCHPTELCCSDEIPKEAKKREKNKVLTKMIIIKRRLPINIGSREIMDETVVI